MQLSDVEKEFLILGAKNVGGCDFSKIVSRLLRGPVKLLVYELGTAIAEALDSNLIMVVGPPKAKPRTYDLSPEVRANLAEAVSHVSRFNSNFPELANLKRSKIMAGQYQQCLETLAAETGFTSDRFKELFIANKYAFTSASAKELASGNFRAFTLLRQTMYAKTTSGIDFQKKLAERLKDLSAQHHAQGPTLSDVLRGKRATRLPAKERFDSYVAALVDQYPLIDENDDDERRARMRRTKAEIVMRLLRSGVRKLEITTLTGMGQPDIERQARIMAYCHRNIDPMPPAAIPDLTALADSKADGGMHMCESVLEQIVQASKSPLEEQRKTFVNGQ